MRYWKLNRTVIIKFFAGLLSVLFISQVAFRSVYTHAHQLSDGSIITHAHPYNKTDNRAPYKSHQHKSFDYVHFELADNLIPLFRTSAGVILTDRIEYIVQHVSNGIIKESHNRLKGRSPPLAFLT